MQHDKQDVNNTGGPRPKTKLLDRAREIMRLRHYSLRTERSYIHLLHRYSLFHDKRHPQDRGPAEIEAFLTHLAVQGKVARSTAEAGLQRPAVSLPRVLGISLDDAAIKAMRAHQKGTLPVLKGQN